MGRRVTSGGEWVEGLPPGGGPSPHCVRRATACAGRALGPRHRENAGAALYDVARLKAVTRPQQPHAPTHPPHQVCGVHANNIINVDLRHKGLTHVLFFPIMHALAVLPVKTIMLKDGVTGGDKLAFTAPLASCVCACQSSIERSAGLSGSPSLLTPLTTALQRQVA
jgi:hypothetical protein